MKKRKWAVILTAFVVMLMLGSLTQVQASVTKPGAVNVSASVSQNKVTLSWGKVKNAAGYQIYQYQESLKKYKRIQTISSSDTTKLTINCQLDQTCLFRIRAYNIKGKETAYGPLTKPVTVKTAPSRVTVTYAKSDSAKTATIKWSKVSSADGYQVFRADSANGSYKKIKTISDQSVLSYKDTGLSSTFSCCYKVRAYRLNGNKAVYGSSSKAAEVKYRSLLFVGDSRTVMMQAAVKTSLAKWICKSGQGYVWFKNTAIPQIEANLYNVNKVIIWLGVNDVHNIDNYISLINKKAAAWSKKGVTTYVCAVGQVEHDPYVTNSEIRAFNLRLMAGLKGTKYINVYTFLKKNGYHTIDGIHYTTATTKRIYMYIIEQLYKT